MAWEVKLEQGERTSSSEYGQQPLEHPRTPTSPMRQPFRLRISALAVDVSKHVVPARWVGIYLRHDMVIGDEVFWGFFSVFGLCSIE